MVFVLLYSENIEILKYLYLFVNSVDKLALLSFLLIEIKLKISSIIIKSTLYFSVLIDQVKGYPF